MSQYAFQSIGEIPTFVNSFEDVNELTIINAVDVSRQGVEFVNHVALLVPRQLPKGNTNSLGLSVEGVRLGQRH